MGELQKTLKLFGFPIFWLWAYPMKVILEKCHAQSIRYLHFYYRKEKKILPKQFFVWCCVNFLDIWCCVNFLNIWCCANFLDIWCCANFLDIWCCVNFLTFGVVNLFRHFCQNNFSVGTILDNDNKLRISMDGLSRKSKKCLKSLHNTKCLKWIVYHNILKRNKLAEKISQKNPKYMLNYSLPCSCSYNLSSFWLINTKCLKSLHNTKCQK
jgi:hypothetical protein